MTYPNGTRVLLVGDAPGVSQLLRTLPRRSVPVGIVAAANRPQYRDELRRLAATHDVLLLVQPVPRSKAYRPFVAAVAALRPDLILCNSYSMILREDLLALAPRASVNVHSGKLPEYRGPNPIQWAIIEGERKTAVTMHEMTPELDAGAVIAERNVPIRFADTWRDLAGRLYAATEELLKEELPAVLAGTHVRRPQDESRARHRPRRTAEDGRIDWRCSVARIYDLVRALGDGVPPAFYEANGERVTVERLSLADVAGLVFAPGPGGRSFVRGGVRLAPAGGELLDLRVTRGSQDRGLVHLEPVDLDDRQVKLISESDDADVAASVLEFARDELGFTIAS